MNKNRGFATTCIHDFHKDSLGSHLPPIYANTTFVYNSAEEGMRRFAGEDDGYIYTRWGNPTVEAVQDKIAALEGFELEISPKCLLFASGMGAISTLMWGMLQHGDNVLSHYSLYAGTDELIKYNLPLSGINCTIEDLCDLNKAEDAFKKKKYKLLYLETPANPTIRCVDLRALSNLAHQYGTLVAVDNTFATPYLQQPFAFGVDYVVHSTTKFLNGHGTGVGGALLMRDTALYDKQMLKTFRLIGACISPYEANMINVGIKTLEIRMERHCDNAEKVARYLEQHPKVAHVNFNGLASHPDYSLCRRQMRRPGALMSFELKGGFDAGVSMMNRVKLCTLTVSLGTTDTLVSHPASMTHHSVPRDERLQYGITDGLIRMSTGIENVEDIIGDLEQALSD